MPQVPDGTRDIAAKCFPAAHILKSFVKSSNSGVEIQSNNATQSVHLQQMNQSAEQSIAPQEQIDGPTLGHSQKEWSRDGMQERVNTATTTSFNNNTAAINVNTTPIVKAPVMVTESGTFTTNVTKIRSEESYLDVQTDQASGNVSSSFMTPTFNVQSQVIDYTKVQRVFSECYCNRVLLFGIAL